MRIHVFRPDLLGARLLNLAYGSALADLCGSSFEMHWPTFHKFAKQSGYKKTNNLHDLYDPERLPSSTAFRNGKLSEVAFVEQAERGTDLIHLLKAAKHAGTPLTAASLAARNDDVIFSHVEPLAIGGIETDQWHALAREKLLGLPDRPEVAAALADIARQLPERRTVAIHIRRGDVVSDIVNQSAEDVAANRHQKAVSNFLMRFVPSGIYASYLRENRFDGALLFSDEEGFVEKSSFKDMLPIVDVTRIVQQLPLSKVQRDFIEIRLMARADALLASQSRFSQLASLYSGRAAIDLSRRGDPALFLDELRCDYGLTRQHPIYSPLEKALQGGLIEC